MTVGVLVLAAGRSVRFGADKRFAPLPHGQRVIDATLATIRDTGLPCLVCIGPDDDVLFRHLDKQDIPVRHCRRAGDGMGSTLAEGIGYIPEWEGVLVALADMPWIASTTYKIVAQQLSAGNIVAPVYQGRRGHPVGFGCDFYHELKELHGDSGARWLLDKHAERVVELPLSDTGIHRDIDVLADLAGPEAIR